MAGQIIELFTWEEVVDYSQPSLKLEYLVIDTDDIEDVNQLVTGGGDPNDGVLLDTVVCQAGTLFFNNWSKRALGGEAWRIEVNYGKDPPRQAGKATFHADSGGEKLHRLQTLQTIEQYSIDKDGNIVSATDFEGAIGVNDDKVEGVDVPAPSFKFTKTIIAGQEMLPENYAMLLWDNRGVVNDAKFQIEHKGQVLTFDTGELRFDDWVMTDPGSDLWEIAYTCAASKNSANVGPIGKLGQAPNNFEIAKAGWEYLWVYYAKSQNNNRWAKQPRQVNIERVSEPFDFTQFIGLGSAVP